MRASIDANHTPPLPRPTSKLLYRLIKLVGGGEILFTWVPINDAMRNVLTYRFLLARRVAAELYQTGDCALQSLAQAQCTAPYRLHRRGYAEDSANGVTSKFLHSPLTLLLSMLGQTESNVGLSLSLSPLSALMRQRSLNRHLLQTPSTAIQSPLFLLDPSHLFRARSVSSRQHNRALYVSKES